MKYDLTRWNRAGLKKIRYVDDNAATCLEMLRQELHDRFPAWLDMEVDVASSETIVQRNVRLEQQYVKVTREWGWEIARSFARASHILLEHLDAYANEASLGTASQWDNMRRLVAMIGYHPAPPASASTSLVLLAKKGQTGLLAKGFQVKYSPKNGPAILFETLEDLSVDVSCNEMRLHNWDKSQTVMTGAVWQLTEKQQLSAGDLAILLNEGNGERHPVRISEVDNEKRLTLAATQGGESWGAWLRSEVKLLLSPVAILTPRLHGNGVVQLPAGHGLVAGDVVAWQASGVWRYNSVLVVDAQAARLVGDLPTAGKELYRAYTISSEGGILRFPGTCRAVSSQKSGMANNLAGYTVIIESGSGPDFTSSYKKISSSPPAEIYLVPEHGEAQTTVVSALAVDEYVFAGRMQELVSGGLVIGELSGSLYQVLQVKTVSKREGDFSLTFVTNPTGQLVRLYGPFAESLRPIGYAINTTPLGSSLAFVPPSGGLSLQLAVGKRVLLERVDDAGATVAGHGARIKTINHQAGVITLDSMPAASAGFTVGTTVLRANVVVAGHGEAKPAKVLGSGDATRSCQSFLLKEKDVSFVADATQSSGVAAAIEVSVGGQIWSQQPTLDDSGPSDAHYTVHITEEGYLRLTFGDGEHGRRLPTGTNNLRVSFRAGAGLVGNVPAASLVKPVKPHVLIDTIRQPLDTSGGNDREPVEALRENAPSALFTLGRAVSLADYARLAERNASVWQASAFRLPNQGAQQERVEVVVVPAGGGDLGELASSLRDYLEVHDLPGVSVDVVNHVLVPFDLSITVQVDSSHYVPEQVVADVLHAVSAAFALKKRRLGQPLYVSEIYQVVEAVTGVASSSCLIGSDFPTVNPAPAVRASASGVVRLVQPTPRQVLVLDDITSVFTVQSKEFVL